MSPTPTCGTAVEAAAARRPGARVQRVAAQLPRQAVHGDLTDDNVVCADGDGARLPDGVIDFGDLTESWAVGELAVTVSSLLHHDGVDPTAVLPPSPRSTRERPLSDAEIEALWPLVVLRGAVLVVSGHQQVAIDGANDYAAGQLAHEWRIFDVACSVPSDVMTALLRARLGRPRRRPRSCRPVPVRSSSDARPHGAGPLLDRRRPGRRRVAAPGHRGRAGGRRPWTPAPASVVTAFGEAAADPVGAAVGGSAGERRHRRRRLVGRRGDPAGAVGRHRRGRRTAAVRRRHVRAVVRRTRCSPRQPRRARPCTQGDALVTVPARTGCASPAARTASRGPGVRRRRSMLPGWLALAADPARCSACPPRGARPRTPATCWRAASRVVRHRAGALLRRAAADRARLARAPGRHRRPRATSTWSTTWRSWATGTRALADAVARQLRRLNTNSRFHYAAVVEFSERLAALLPDPLDTVFLVNSGSEAVDLALRLAWPPPAGGTSSPCGEAYHGWTYATDAVSTSVADNPNALAPGPTGCTPLDSPNTYRGHHRGGEAHRYAPRPSRASTRSPRPGMPPAAFICEPVYGNAGGMALPDGYLAAVYDAVRRHGGLASPTRCRSATAGSASGSGASSSRMSCPTSSRWPRRWATAIRWARSITTRAIADALPHPGLLLLLGRRQPGLQRRRARRARRPARRGAAGERPRRRRAPAEAAARRSPSATRSSAPCTARASTSVWSWSATATTLEPATEETAAICERMRELGVIMQPTCDRMSVLKIKPPLCLSRGAADFFVDTLDRVLTTGW